MKRHSLGLFRVATRGLIAGLALFVAGCSYEARIDRFFRRDAFPEQRFGTGALVREANRKRLEETLCKAVTKAIRIGGDARIDRWGN